MKKAEINNWECTPESDLSLSFSGQHQRLAFCQPPTPSSSENNKNDTWEENESSAYLLKRITLLASGWATLRGCLIAMDRTANLFESHVGPI